MLNLRRRGKLGRSLSLRSRCCFPQGIKMIQTLETWVDNPPEIWDEIICQLGGTIFQSRLWAEYVKKTQNVQPIFFLGRDADGNKRGVALALYSQSPWPIASLIFRTARLTAHPVICDPQAGEVEAFMGLIEDYARSLGCGRLILESFMSGNSTFSPTTHAYAESSRFEFHLDLTRDPDELWKGIGKDQRDKIKRLTRDGFSIEEGKTQNDLHGLGMVREATQAKRSARGQGYDSSADTNFYEDLFDYLVSRGAGRLFLAKEGSEVIAGLFFSTFNGRAYSVFSGATDRGYRLGAQSGIFWAAVETFRREGFTLLNRGGVPAAAEQEGHPQHGIYVFKKRLGTTPRLCSSGEKILSPTREWLVRLRDRLR